MEITPLERRKGNWRDIVNKGSLGGIKSLKHEGFHWLSCLSLAGFLPGWFFIGWVVTASHWLSSCQARRGSLSSCCWALLSSQDMSYLFWSPDFFNWDVCLLIFTAAMCPALGPHFLVSMSAKRNKWDTDRTYGMRLPGNPKGDALTGGTNFMPFTLLPTFCLEQVCDGELSISHQELCSDWGMEVISQESKNREMKGAWGPRGYHS